MAMLEIYINNERQGTGIDDSEENIKRIGLILEVIEDDNGYTVFKKNLTERDAELLRESLLKIRKETEIKQSSQALPPHLLELKRHDKRKVTTANFILESLLGSGHTLEEIAGWSDNMILRQRHMWKKTLPYFKDILQWRIKK